MRTLLSILGRQELLRFGVRDRIIRFFHNPEFTQDEPFTCPFYGKTYPGNFNTFIDWSVYYFGAYTKAELTCMQEFLAPIPSPIIVDVGANVGHHTLFASTLARHVHAFEPFPNMVAKLEEKLRLNGISNVSVHRIGLGDAHKSLPFTPSATNNTGTGTFLEKPDAAPSVELEVRAADEFFPAVGLTHIDYLKMDIEGFECYALAGMQETLRQCRPICFIEWNQPPTGDFRQNGANLFPENYLFYRFDPDQPFLVFFNRQSYRLRPVTDIWPESNLLAVPREYLDKVNALRPASPISHRFTGF